MKKILLLLFSIVVIWIDISGQSVSDSVPQTSFRKGRNLVGLSGSINSSSVENPQGLLLADTYINKYYLDIKLGKFFADKNLLGIVFNTTRGHTTDYIEVEKEIMSIGPWYRLYIGSTY